MAVAQYITIRKGDTTRITKDFSAGQFYSHSSTAPAEHPLNAVLPQAVQLVQDTLGQPLCINSTVRFPGGESYSGENSQHSPNNANAVDVGFACAHDAKATRELAAYWAKDIINQGPLFQRLFALGIRGYGLYDTFIHIDARPTPASSTHTYKGTPYNTWDNRVSNKPALALVADLTMPTQEPDEDDRSLTQKTGERTAFFLFWLLLPTVVVLGIAVIRRKLRS